jgi:hypothetical protein
MTVRVGTRLVGLRVSTPEMAEASRQVLAPSLVHGVVAPPNVSVLTTEAHAGRGLFLCYRSNAVVTRARSVRRAVQSALALLSSFDHAVIEGLVRIPAVVAIRDRSAVVLSPPARMTLDALIPRLRTAGWAVLDATTADIDPGSGDVVVPPPAVEVDTDALSRLPGHPTDSPPVPPGRYRVVMWVDAGSDGSDPPTAAARVAVVAALADELDERTASTVIGAVAAMLQDALWVSAAGTDAGELAEAVSRATSG